MENKDMFSPWYDPNKPDPITGKLHTWVPFDGAYYGPAFECSGCHKRNKGWNLWKEDYLETCTAT